MSLSANRRPLRRDMRYSATSSSDSMRSAAPSMSSYWPLLSDHRRTTRRHDAEGHHGIRGASARAGHYSRVLRFKGLEVGDDVRHLAGIELEFRHAGMAGTDTFRQRFGKTLDRIAFVQRPQRRRDLQRAGAHPVDRMALGTVRTHIGEA